MPIFPICASPYLVSWLLPSRPSGPPQSSPLLSFSAFVSAPLHLVQRNAGSFALRLGEQEAERARAQARKLAEEQEASLACCAALRVQPLWIACFSRNSSMQLPPNILPDTITSELSSRPRCCKAREWQEELKLLEGKRARLQGAEAFHATSLCSLSVLSPQFR